MRVRQRTNENEVGNREGGGIRTNAEPCHHDRGHRKTGGVSQQAEGVAEILAKQVGVYRERGGEQVRRHPEPDEPARHDSGCRSQFRGEHCRHLVSVLLAERRRQQMQQPAIRAHQAGPVAKPCTRAIRTSCISRRASARATSLPKGVIR